MVGRHGSILAIYGTNTKCAGFAHFAMKPLRYKQMLPETAQHPENAHTAERYCAPYTRSAGFHAQHTRLAACSVLADEPRAVSFGLPYSCTPYSSL